MDSQKAQSEVCFYWKEYSAQSSCTRECTARDRHILQFQIRPAAECRRRYNRSTCKFPVRPPLSHIEIRAALPVRFLIHKRPANAFRCGKAADCKEYFRPQNHYSDWMPANHPDNKTSCNERVHSAWFVPF